MKTIILSAALAAFVSLAGCNTIAGMGKDITKGAEKVEEKIDEATD